MMVKMGDVEISMDGYLVENLSILKQAVQMDWDGVGYICGFEGDGKTVLGAQICAFLDPNFNLDNVVFNGEQFIEAIERAEPGTAILYDEAYEVFENKASWQEVSRKIKGMLTRIRKKRLYLIIISPVFFEISTYITLHRSRFMINVYSEGLTRGFFRFFNREAKYNLYQHGYKFKNMYAWKPNFIGRFVKHFPIDREAYEAKKDKSLIRSEPKENDGKKFYEDGIRYGIGFITDKYHLPQKNVAKDCNINPRTLRFWIHKAKLTPFPLKNIGIEGGTPHFEVEEAGNDSQPILNKNIIEKKEAEPAIYNDGDDEDEQEA